MLKLLADFVQLVILILLAPLFLLCIGPLMVLAVIRGQQWAGPLTLDSRRYDGPGRAGILMLGLAIWLLVWSGLIWLGVTVTSSASLAQLSPALPSSALSSITLTPTSTQTPHIITPTATKTLATPTALPITPTQALIAITPPPTVTPTSSPTSPLLATPSVAVRVTPTEAAGQTPATPTQPVNSIFTNRQVAIRVIEEANLLLEKAIALPSEENLANLSQFWQDRALLRVEQFAINQYDKYAKPFDASVEFIASPAITQESGSGQLVVTSQERWSYGGNLNADQESFEFIYTLSRQADGRWKIIHYTYRNLPPATQNETATPGPAQN